jgi:hypothetical protein
MYIIKKHPSKKCSKWRWRSRHLMTRYSYKFFTRFYMCIIDEWADKRHCSSWTLVGLLEIRILNAFLWNIKTIVKMNKVCFFYYHDYNKYTNRIWK